MEENHLTPSQSSTDSVDDAECGYLGIKSLLARAKPVTAIVAGNDLTAHGIYKALRERGISVPFDVSVVGCDDTVGSLLTPALSSTREFPEQLGRQLVELAISRITKPDQDPQCVVIPTEFIKRDSCAPPRTAAPAYDQEGQLATSSADLA
jgi:DNA-binding LacI/PurR family transcriptional regulator